MKNDGILIATWRLQRDNDIYTNWFKIITNCKTRAIFKQYSSSAHPSKNKSIVSIFSCHVAVIIIIQILDVRLRDTKETFANGLVGYRNC